MASKLDWALFWAARGFRVFPLHPDSKVPAMLDYLNGATRDPEAIRQLWTNRFIGYEEDYNIGAVPCDQILVDLDEKDGRNGIAQGKDFGLVFDTLTCRTPSGGLHLWYVGPPTANTAGTVLPGMDTRGPNGFAVMPGSTIDGKAYALVLDRPLAPVPEVLLYKLRAPRDKAADQTPAVDPDCPSALAMAAAFLDDTPGAVRGAQNDTTFRVAAHLRDLGLTEHTAAAMIDQRWAIKCQPQIPSEEIFGIVANAYMYAQNTPGIKHPMADFGGYVHVPGPAPVFPAVGQPQQLDLFDTNPFMCFGNMVPIEELKPRDWLLTRFMERKAITSLLAPGGVGKSQLSLTIAAHLANGSEEIFGFENKYGGTPQYSVIYNAEDDMQEMSARLHALCVLMNWDYRRISPYIALVSGRTLPLKIMTRHGSTAVIEARMQQMLACLIQACLKVNAVFLGLDPLNKLHQLDENNNIEMAMMMENLAKLVELANVAGLLSHHMNKPSFAAGASYAGNPASSRGAGEIINGSRAAYTLSPCTPEDISSFGLTPERALRLLRLDNAKLNRALLTVDATWIERASATLVTGESVGAFLPAHPRQDTEEVRAAMARTLVAEMTQGGRGAMQLGDAAAALMRGDAVYDQLSITAVKNRIERFLYKPMQVDQHIVSIVVQDGKKTVTMT